MSEGRWLASPALEREIANRRRRLARYDALVLVGGIGGLIASLGLVLWLSILLESDVPIVAWMIAAAVIGLKFTFGMPRRRARLAMEAQASDLALREEFSGGNGWLVDLIVHQGDAPTGSDRGMLWIEDGRLYFSGHRTSFGLTADQAADFCRHGGSIPGLRHGLQLLLNVGTAAGPLSISVSPAGPRTWEERKAAFDLREEINRWNGRGGADGGQLPPLAFGPQTPSARVLFRQAAVVVGFWVTTLGGFLLLLVRGDVFAYFGFVFAALLIGSLWRTAWHPRVRLRAWRDRRRLERRTP